MSGLGIASGLKAVINSEASLLRNSAESLKASANAFDALSKGDLGGALKSGTEAMQKNIEGLKDASKALDSAGTVLENVTK